MLALTRGTGEIIRINDCISIQVISVKGQVVKLLIIAPTDTTIHRGELYLQIKKPPKTDNSI